VTVLRLPAEIAVGQVSWEDAREPGGWGHLLAIGAVEVPDGTAVRLHVNPVAEVGVYGGDQAFGIFERLSAPAGAGSVPTVPLRRRRVRFARPARYRRSRKEREERVTWHKGMPGSALRNTRSIWGEPAGSYWIGHDHGAVDLEFLRGLPADSVFSLSVGGNTGGVVPASFAAVSHLAPGLRHLGVYLDGLGDDAPSVIAGLTALASLTLVGDSAMDKGRRLDDHALSVIAGLPALEELTLLDGAYTEHGLQQLGRLRKLRHLHVEREGLTAPMFRFAAIMPALTRLTGLDEFGDDGPMPPAEVDQVRAMLPHISMD
jgi:hypothetical protein